VIRKRSSVVRGRAVGKGHPCTSLAAYPTTRPVLRGGNGGNAISLTRPWKRGQRYGIILVDQERQRIVELLEERSTDALAAWLREHPIVHIITRDRSQEFARAATDAAPQALQVADRFHLVKNLVDVLKPALARCHQEFPVSQTTAVASSEQSSALSSEPWRPRNPRQAEQAIHARAVERATRYAQMRELREQGFSYEAIAQSMHLSDKTVRRWLRGKTPPVHAFLGRRRPSKFDPFAPYVLMRWQAGETDGPRLYQEISRQGYQGTVRTVQRFLQTLRPHRRAAHELLPSPYRSFSAKEAIWWFIRFPADLPESIQSLLTTVCTSSPTAAHLYALMQRFVCLLRQGDLSSFLPWLLDMESSTVPECRRFAEGIRRDQSAVEAAIVQHWSNGRTEGFVNRLKTLKRNMYGRAKFPLLRHRVLSAA
jgi:transposase